MARFGPVPLILQYVDAELRGRTRVTKAEVYAAVAQRIVAERLGSAIFAECGGQLVEAYMRYSRIRTRPMQGRAPDA